MNIQAANDQRSVWISSFHSVKNTVAKRMVKFVGRDGVSGVIKTLLIFSVTSVVVSAQELSTTSQLDDSPSVTVYVGVRDDAKPFSYIDVNRRSESVIPGYSGYSVEVCRHVLTKMKTLPKYRNLNFKAGDISANYRLKKLGEVGELFMLCGPDSITQERLVDYRASLPFFLSGMTYAYLNPQSKKFPRSNYCEHIIGVVRGTTADKDGLSDIAARGLLMRFNEALKLEINKTSERVAQSRETLRDLIAEMLNEENLKNYNFGRKSRDNYALVDEYEQQVSELKLVANEDLGNLVHVVGALADRGNRLAQKVNALMRDQHKILNEEIAKEIVTDECPSGFSSLPVRKYESHDVGIKAFCNGDVLYYLADYDILQSKIEEISGCDVVMNRFTRSREVYGAFFSKDDLFVTKTDDNTEVEINAAGFYADFNNFLTMSMQGQFSDVERIFSEEFTSQKMSDELANFFESLKIE